MYRKLIIIIVAAIIILAGINCSKTALENLSAIEEEMQAELAASGADKEAIIQKYTEELKNIDLSELQDLIKVQASDNEDSIIELTSYEFKEAVIDNEELFVKLSTTISTEEDFEVMILTLRITSTETREITKLLAADDISSPIETLIPFSAIKAGVQDITLMSGVAKVEHLSIINDMLKQELENADESEKEAIIESYKSIIDITNVYNVEATEEIGTDSQGILSEVTVSYFWAEIINEEIMIMGDLMITPVDIIPDGSIITADFVDEAGDDIEQISGTIENQSTSIEFSIGVDAMLNNQKIIVNVILAEIIPEELPLGEENLEEPAEDVTPEEITPDEAEEIEYIEIAPDEDVPEEVVPEEDTIIEEEVIEEVVPEDTEIDEQPIEEPIEQETEE